MSDPPDWYGSHVEEVSARFESLAAPEVHDWLIDLLPRAPSLVLDVGAGSGRDAAWLSERGLDVVAVEPSAAMREVAQRFHPSPRIRWVADSLPGLDKVCRLGLAFDLILLSGVWMFVAPADRQRAFRKLVTLLKPGGRIALTLRYGPSLPEQGMHEVSAGEIEALARAHGALVERAQQSRDLLGRPDVSWTEMAVRLPDDGTGALPLLRNIILNDSKTTTYKLALLRVLCRIADGAAGYARQIDDGFVAVPLGLIALFWLRLFKPLLGAGLPQSPRNLGDKGLKFVGEGFRALADVSHLDLRVGMGFGPERSGALHAALADACATITDNPANFITYADGTPVFPATRAARSAKPAMIRLEADYLWSFGNLCVPAHLWRALQRFDVWIEPALIAEWTRMIGNYASRQGRTIDPDTSARAMIWSDPARDVAVARQQALRLLASHELRCAWTGCALTTETLDIDHCFPWAAWPCGDLWNLMPADRTVNQRKKRERLPGAALLRASQDRIEDWWKRGYLQANNDALSRRFFTEAQATLPMFDFAVDAGTPRLDDIFAAMSLQQFRLRFDQQAPVWEPAAG